MRLWSPRVVALCVAGLAACGDPATPSVGRDCAALLDAARKADRCDARLAAAAERLEQDPDEQQCRVAVRAMLNPETSDTPALRSVHAEEPAPADEPLSSGELSALRSLALPATVVLVPDVPPGPGVTRTRATVDGVELVPETTGRLTTTIQPGARALLLHHGGASTTYCVELRACETLSVKAHGARLARHPDVRPGDC